MVCSSEPAMAIFWKLRIWSLPSKTFLHNFGILSLLKRWSFHVGVSTLQLWPSFNMTIMRGSVSGLQVNSLLLLANYQMLYFQTRYSLRNLYWPCLVVCGTIQLYIMTTNILVLQTLYSIHVMKWSALEVQEFKDLFLEASFFSNSVSKQPSGAFFPSQWCWSYPVECFRKCIHS